MSLRDINIKDGNDILQRIANLGNWLTYEEKLAVNDEFNETVSVFMVLERVLGRPFGFDAIETKGGCSPNKKSVNDFINWKNEGDELAFAYRMYVESRKSFLTIKSEEEKTLFGGANKISRFVDAVMNMSVTVPKKE